MTAAEKTARLRDKVANKQGTLKKCSEKIENAKALAKVLKKEISVLNGEIRIAELEELSEFLNENGITFSDIHSAVSSGLIIKNINPEDTAEKTEDEENGAINITEEQEETIDGSQIGGSRKDVGDE